MITRRWVEGRDCSQEDWDRIELILAARGWMSLSRQLTRVRLAEEDGKILGLFVFQMVPYAGPLWVSPSQRGLGLAEALAKEMLDFLVQAEARGWIVVADNPHSAKLCEDFGMRRVEVPVYTTEIPSKEKV